MSFHPQRVTVAAMVYIPHQTGYFSQRLDIFRICLLSLRANTKIPFDMLVLANGCCPEVVDALRGMQQKGLINTLIVSNQNLGVLGGYKVIFSAAQGEVVAYCDDDVAFYPGWLEAQLSILDNFPKVGMVSGVPVRDGAAHAQKSIQNLVQNPSKGMVVKRGRFIPDEWEVDWCISTGRDPDEYMRSTKDKLDIMLEYKGLSAIGSANHFQFVARKGTVIEALPSAWSQNLMDSLVPFEEEIDRLGYLRLSTKERYCKHIGNMISPQLAEEYKFIETKPAPVESEKKKSLVLRIPGMGRLLWKVYDWTFKVLNQVK